MGTIELTTDRLRLRPFRVSDADAMTQVFGDPDVMRFGDGPRDAAWIRDWIEGRQQENRVWAVVERGTGDVLGYCGFFTYEIDGCPETEIGFRLGKAHWGRGFATEAATAVREHGFGTLGLSRLVCLIDPANTASIRVAEKLGMTFEREAMLPGHTHPDHLYVVVAGEV